MPARSLAGMGDHPSAWRCSARSSTALYQRERTGRGGLVGSSLLANGLWANACQVQTSLCGEPVAVQPPPEAAQHAMRTHYQCRDGRWLILAIVPNEARWQTFTRVVGGGLARRSALRHRGRPRRQRACADRRHRRDLPRHRTSRIGAACWTRPASCSASSPHPTTSAPTGRRAPPARWCPSPTAAWRPSAARSGSPARRSRRRATRRNSASTATTVLRDAGFAEAEIGAAAPTPASSSRGIVA